MREIKFRYWDVEKQHMFHSDSQDDAKCLGAKPGSSLISAFFNRFYGLDNVEQFTGLKDKNGVEIYEGDILDVITHGFNSEHFKSVVVWSDCGFYLQNNRSLMYFGQTTPICTDACVIGNIHQHPELLTS